MRALLPGLVAAVLLTPAAPLTPPAAKPTESTVPAALKLAPAVLNDNRTPAGVMDGQTLSLDLSIVETDWRPMGSDQPGATVYAFAEAGGEPTIPGPLVRVRQGTFIRASITNTLDTTIVVQGLSARRQPSLDVMTIAAGETQTAEFEADVEGTYHYWGAEAREGVASVNIRLRRNAEETLGGAFVVDPAEGEVPDDRIMIINIYRHKWTPDTPVQMEGTLRTINGAPWPHTERLTYDMGDSIRWRMINASDRGHPMHLHGFYFRVDSRGDMAQDSIYWPAARRMAVTEGMSPGTTMSMVWSPNRPGGWIFHCHLSFHVTPNIVLGTVRPDPLAEATEALFGNPEHDPAHHVEQGMGGLMSSIYIRPPEGYVVDEPKRMQMRLLIQSDSAAAPEGADPFVLAAPYRRQFAYVLQHGDIEPAADSVHLPGSTLILRKGEPTSIWVVNRTEEASAVHWHGLEIESLFDGVVGIGGYPTMPSPPVMPGDSFEIRFTPPRAGSFMYHTHVSDLRQQSAGLYGPFVILEEDEEWDPTYDKVLLLGLSPTAPGVHLNGTTDPPPMDMTLGESYRMRLMNITLANGGVRVRIVRDGDAARWTLRAKDGFDVPEHQRVTTPADQRIDIGETMDFDFTPGQPGEYVLEVRSGGGRLFASQEIRIRQPR